MNNADRYSGLVTAFAILVMIFYSEEMYDEWDFLLGAIGCALAWKYTLDIKKSDILFTILVSALYSTSIITIIYYVIQESSKLQDIVEGTFFASSFNLLLSLIVILTIILKFITRKRKF